MGSNAIFAVLGFIVVFTIVDMSMNKSNLRSYENTYGYVKHSAARDIARNSIQLVLRKIDSTKTITSSDLSVSGSLDGGTYSISGTVINTDTLKLAVMSTFSDSIYKIKATLVRRQIPLPPALYRGAFGIYPDSVTFKYSGSNDSIDGRDHDRNGKLLPASSDTVPPIEVRTVTDSISVLASGGVDSPVKLSTVVGSPKIWVDPGMSNPNTSSDSLKLIADSIIYSPANATVQLGDIGDSTHPKIVFCDGTNSGTGKTTGDFALNGDSWGILVVKGGLKLKANATWHGAVIQYGNVPLTFNASAGQSQIYGGLIMGGKNGGTYDMGGNSKVIHSREALNLRDKIKDPYIYQIVDWYE